MQLLKTQKNQVYELIEEAELSPSMFSFDDPNDADGITHLRLKDSQYYYNFATARSGGHYARYSPGYDTLYEDQAPGSWSGQLVYVRRWLGYLTREIKSPDKWKTLQDEIKNMDFGDIKYEDTKFSFREYELLKEKITELKDKISKLDLIEEQITQINKKLDHLLDLAKDMNKMDWKEMFVGSLISLFMQLSIDKGTGQTIVGYVKGLFVKLLSSG